MAFYKKVDQERLYYYKILALILKKHKFEDIAKSVNLSLGELLDFMEKKEIANKAKVPLYVDEGGPRLIYRKQEHNYHYVKTVNRVIKMMITSDWHIDHRDDREDLIDHYYNMAAKKDVQFVINLGDYLNGPLSSYLLEKAELNNLSDSQLKKIGKVRTGTLEGSLERLQKLHCPEFMHYFTTGNHDLYFIDHSSVNIGEEIEKSCENLTFLGDCLAYLQINDFRMTLSHGNYENIKNSAHFLDRINLKKQYPYLTKNNPHLVAQGHFHFGQDLLNRAISCLQIPCLKTSSSRISRSKRIALPGVVFLTIYPTKDVFEVEYEAAYSGEKELVLKKDLVIKK